MDADVFADEVKNEDHSDNITIDGEVVEDLFDYYNHTNTTSDVDDATSILSTHIDSTYIASGTAVNVKYVDPKSLGNIRLKGIKKLEEMNIPKIRERRQKRAERSQLFHLKVQDKVTSTNNKT